MSSEAFFQSPLSVNFPNIDGKINTSTGNVIIVDLLQTQHSITVSLQTVNFLLRLQVPSTHVCVAPSTEKRELVLHFQETVHRFRVVFSQCHSVLFLVFQGPDFYFAVTAARRELLLVEENDIPHLAYMALVAFQHGFLLPVPQFHREIRTT